MLLVVGLGLLADPQASSFKFRDGAKGIRPQTDQGHCHEQSRSTRLRAHMIA